MKDFTTVSAIDAPSQALSKRLRNKARNFRKKLPKPSLPSLGILLMLIHALAMAFMYVAKKNLVQNLGPGQVAFLFKFTIFISILPWCLTGDRKRTLYTKKLPYHVARAFFSTLGAFFFASAIVGIDIADATAITYLEGLIVMSIGWIYFQEPFSYSRLFAVVCGIIGTFLIYKPGFTQFTYHYVYLLIALTCWAINNVSIKILVRTERTKTQLFFVMMFSSLFSTPLALADWQPISQGDIFWIVSVALCYLIHTVCFFKALKYADISIVMPFDYSRMIFASILGYIFFGETTDTIALVGYALICCGGVSVIYTDRHYRKKSAKAQNNNDANKLAN